MSGEKSSDPVVISITLLALAGEVFNRWAFLIATKEHKIQSVLKCVYILIHV